ncbi:MAG: hypothetical protein ACOX81_05845 [Candidatus Heteroscillospira sp.]|jgi:hypothetical protein
MFVVKMSEVEPRWWLVALEMILAAIVSASSGVLGIYLCIAIGHLFSKHRIAAAVVAFVVLSSLSTQLMALIFRLLDSLGVTDWVNSLLSHAGGSLSVTAYGLLFYIGLGLVTCTVKFAVTTYILSRKLNLE